MRRMCFSLTILSVLLAAMLVAPAAQSQDTASAEPTLLAQNQQPQQQAPAPQRAQDQPAVPGQPGVPGQEDALPRTASYIPAAAVAGVLALIGAVVLRRSLALHPR